jgi:hypothetical protein
LIALSSVSLASACGGGDTHEAPVFGAPCSASVPCSSGLSCLPTADGTGYCTTTCGSAACPTGTTCNTGFGASVCFSLCATDSDCHATQQCWAGSCQPACGDDAACGGAGASCVSGRCQGPECTSDTQCSATQSCVGGHCVTASDGGGLGQPDGAACTRSSDCTSGLCLPPDHGGVCTTACTNGDTCFLEPWTSSCGVATIDGHFGTYCVRYVDGLGGNGHYCTSDAGCDNLTCIQNQCRAVCDAQTQCLLGQHCQSITYPGGGTFMGCGYDPGPASGTEVRTVDLGTYSVAAMMGTPQILFATPPETISVTLRARQVGGDPLEMFFYRVQDAGGEIFSLVGMGNYVDQTIRWYPFDATSAVAMQIPNTTPDNPNTHNYTYRPGFMQFDMAAYPPTGGAGGTVNMHVDALEVVAAAPPTTGALHLRIHLVGVGVTAAAAPTNARVMAFMSRFTAIMGMVGITVADVSYVDINAPALAIIDTADGESSELSQLFRMSTGTTENVLNLFLVQEVRAGDSGEFNTLGIAGGIPGPARIHGSSHSGVVIAFSTGAVGAGTAGGDLAGHVAAHECGHFMGLFHTTENGRACGAGEIPSATDMCVPFGGTDVIGDTNVGDSSNLMHYVVMGSNWHLTPGQGFVELRNPLTH